jgi:hypothetical protein
MLRCKPKTIDASVRALWPFPLTKKGFYLCTSFLNCFFFVFLISFSQPTDIELSVLSLIILIDLLFLRKFLSKPWKVRFLLIKTVANLLESEWARVRPISLLDLGCKEVPVTSKHRSVSQRSKDPEILAQKAFSWGITWINWNLFFFF